VVAALASGDQVLLLRKGGIAESRRGFELRYGEFLLYPTYEHQQEKLVKPRFQPLLREELAALDEGEVRITHLARVERLVRAPETIEEAECLAPYHMWSQDWLRQRYQYRPELPLWLVLLRVFRLASPQVIRERASYAGCKSWVHLTEEIPVEGAVPVLAEGPFRNACGKLAGALALMPRPGPPTSSGRRRTL